MRIAQTLKNDKRSNSKIEAVVHNTRIYLTFNNVHFNLSYVEASRMASVLDKAIAIQITSAVDKRMKAQLEK